MQVVENRDLRRRTRFYQSMIDIDKFEAGAFYKNLKDMIIIFICPFDLFKQGKSRYTFENICIEDTSIRLGDGVQKIFLNAKGFAKEKDPKLHNLLAFINGENVENDSFIDRLSKKIHEIKNTKEWRIEHMKMSLREQDAFHDGHFEGERRGILEGERRGKIEASKSLLHILDDATIAKTMSLPLEKVQEIRKQALDLVN